jgi:hydroxyacylglutathione hydrolase
MLEVFPIPAFTDNYIWAMVNTEQRTCAIVDPGSAEPVQAFLAQHHYQLSSILITHHHHDHTGGVQALVASHNVPVYGPCNPAIPNVTRVLSENEQIHLDGLALNFSVLAVPGHTLDHIAYYGANMLFCGDTLFSAGCGRLFEGTAEQMFASLQKINALPDNTLIYCAHEYTEDNLRFALTVQPANKILQKRLNEVKRLRQQHKPSVPVCLADEKRYNLFLQCRSVAAFAELRKLKDQY